MQSFNVAPLHQDLSHRFIRWLVPLALAAALPTSGAGARLEFLPRRAVTSTQSSLSQLDLSPVSSSFLQLPLRSLVAQSRNQTRSSLQQKTAKGSVVSEDFLKRKGLPVSPDFAAWVKANPMGAKLTKESVEKATRILNGMLLEQRIQLDKKELECQGFKESYEENIRFVKEEAASLGGDIANQRAVIAAASPGIVEAKRQFSEAKLQLEKLKKECADSQAVKNQRSVRLTKDKTILSLIMKDVKSSCKGDMGKLLQTGAGDTTVSAVSSKSLKTLVVCPGPGGGQPRISFVAEAINRQFSSLSVETKHNLSSAMLQVEHDSSFAKRHDTAHRSVVSKSKRKMSPEFGPEGPPLDVGSFEGPPLEGPPMEGPGEELGPGDAVPVETDMSQEGPPDSLCVTRPLVCGQMVDKVGMIRGQTSDAEAQLSAEMVRDEEDCKDEEESLNRDMDRASTAQGELGTKLSEATATLTQLNVLQQEKQQEQREMEKEFKNVWSECKSAIYEFSVEGICGLTTVRDTIQIAVGYEELSQDCEVTDWVEGECSATCAGGTRIMFRQILAPTKGGHECPPLQMNQKCMEQKCPVDCAMGSWSGWTKCTVECGGGVQERARNIVQRASGGGQTCPAVSDTQECNSDPCNAPCELHDWSLWSSCSHACDGGLLRRKRKVKFSAKGNGKCPARTAPERLQFQKCNANPCPQGPLKCTANDDILIVVDSSGSLSEIGFKSLKDLAKHLGLMYAPTTSDIGPRVGLISFSGEARIVVPLTDDVDEFENGAEKLEWLRGATDLAMGFGAAKAAFLHRGREGAGSTIVVLTDGRLADLYQSSVSAEELKDQGVRIVIVPVRTKLDPAPLVELASVPTKDNLFPVTGGVHFLKKHVKTVAHKLLVDTCSAVAARDKKLAKAITLK